MTIDFSEQDKAIAAALSRKMLSQNTDVPWSMDVSEAEFDFILGVLTLVEGRPASKRIEVVDDDYEALERLITKHAPELHCCAVAELRREIIETWLSAVYVR